MAIPLTVTSRRFGNAGLSHYHPCECGLQFKYLFEWMRHVPHCPEFMDDNGALEQVQDCPRYTAVPHGQHLTPIEALEFAVKVANLDRSVFAHAPFRVIHEHVKGVGETES